MFGWGSNSQLWNCQHSMDRLLSPQQDPKSQIQSQLQSSLEVPIVLGCGSCSGNKGIAKTIRAESVETLPSPAQSPLSCKVTPGAPHCSSLGGSALPGTLAKGKKRGRVRNEAQGYSPHAHTSDPTPPKTCFAFLWHPWITTAEKKTKKNPKSQKTKLRLKPH